MRQRMIEFGGQPLRNALRQPVRLGRWTVSWLFAVLGFSLLYFAAARLGLLLATMHGNVSPVWPATGVAIGGLLVGGRRLWPGIALAAFAVNISTSVGFTAAVTIAIGNTLEGILGATLVRWLAHRYSKLGQLAEPLGIIAAACVAPITSATVGVGSLALGKLVPFTLTPQLWQTWWVGDALGALVITPVVLIAAGGRDTSLIWNRVTALKAVSLTTCVAGVCGLIFTLATGVEWLFLVFPLLLIAVAWFDSTGVRLTALLISSISIAAVYLGVGPLPGQSLNHSLLNVQFFMASVAMAALVLPAFRAAGGLFYPGMVLLVGWGVSGWMFSSLYQERLKADETHFKDLTIDAERAIAQRMQTYEDALRGAAGMFAASELVTRAEWRAYAASLRLNERYPGIQGVGAVFAVAESKADEFVAAARQDGAANFAIHPVPNVSRPPTNPDGREHEHFVVTYIEPFENNHVALGLDVASETQRRTAAETARDSGQPRITGRITLVQDGQKRPGFHMYMPMYAAGTGRETVEERRQSFRGWVYAPFITELYLANVMGEEDSEVALHFFDGDSLAATNLLFASTASPVENGFIRVSRLELAGHRFSLGWTRGPAFIASDNTAAVLAGSSSALVSLLLAGLVVSLHSLGRRANEIAAARTLELQGANARLEQQIAERQRVEAELRASEERSKAALDATSEGLWDWNVVTGEVYFSPRLIEVLGYDPAEVRGHVDTWIAWLHPDDLPAAMAAVKEHFEGRTTNYENEHRLRKKSGEWMWNLDRGQVVQRDAQGQPLRMIGTHTDISVRKRAEEETLRLAAVLEATSDCVGIADVHGHIIYINRAMRRTVGIPDDASVAGLVIPDFHPEKWTRYLKAEGLPAAARDGFWEGETALQRRDGTEVPASQVIVAHKDANGKVTCFSTIMRDITERKRVEEELRRAKENAEATNRAKSEFLAIMSHEIRTPMNGVIGFTDILLDSELTPAQREWVRTIQNSGQGLLAVINDILDFSKIEAGKLTLEQIPFEPLVTFWEAHALLAPKAAAKHIELRLETLTAPPEWLLGDPGRLRQVILNLASNAIKFTALGTVRIEVDWQASGAGRGILKVAVHDTGIGIPPEKQAMLFEKFTQADSSTTRKFGGTGLGLAICKRIIEMQAGRIGVRSQPGSGSTFWIELPLEVSTASQADPVTPASEAREAQPPGEPRPLRILLAEDVVVNQTLATSLLKKLGCTVDVAANGHEAVACATEGSYDLIFMDCQMPELDGFDAAREIRRREAAVQATATGPDSSRSASAGPRRRVPIVAVTANAMQGDRDLCLAAGMDDYISKPFRVDDLTRAVNRWARPAESVAP